MKGSTPPKTFSTATGVLVVGELRGCVSSPVMSYIMQKENQRQSELDGKS